ncbi:MAG: hypothetical protein MJ177_02050 [Clostridia bacterium]|nr:hypothetical protein [Clostridia bacterium]
MAGSIIFTHQINNPEKSEIRAETEEGSENSPPQGGRKKMKNESELTVITKAKDAEGRTDLDEIKQVLSSYRSHLLFGHTYKLQKKVLGEFVLRRGNEDDM